MRCKIIRLLLLEPKLYDGTKSQLLKILNHKPNLHNTCALLSSYSLDINLEPVLVVLVIIYGTIEGGMEENE